MPPVVKMINTPEGAENPEKADANTFAKPPPDRWGPEWSTVWATLVLGVVGLFQLGMFLRQLRYVRVGMNDAKTAAEAAIDAAKAAIEGNKINRENAIAVRRAWLSIMDVKARSPTQITDRGGLLSIVAKVKNIGTTPALAIRFEATGFCAEDKSPDHQSGYEAFKSRLSNHPPAGIIIFPNESLIEGTTWSFTGEQVKQFLASRPPDWGTLSFVIFVGASYQIVGSQQRRLTIFEYSLHMPINSAIQLDRPQELLRNPFISGEVD